MIIESLSFESAIKKCSTSSVYVTGLKPNNFIIHSRWKVLYLEQFLFLVFQTMCVEKDVFIEFYHLYIDSVTNRPDKDNRIKLIMGDPCVMNLFLMFSVK